MKCQVFKFGGASVKNADAVRNVVDILSNYSQKKILIIVSAMGKTTNALEKLLWHYQNNSSKRNVIFTELKDFHFEILNNLIPDKEHIAHNELRLLFENLKSKISNINNQNQNIDYANIVSFGELFSSLIVFHYIKECNLSIVHTKAYEYIVTDNNYLEAKVDWEESYKRINCGIKPLFDDNDLVISQGFISGTHNTEITTLGREGSDYSASIFAYGLDAESVTIWKDVPGLLNADPKYFSDTTKLDSISYRETIELAYYGASIIHPKTIKPLQNKLIPLNIKSFLNPSSEGTIIHSDTYSNLKVPSYIFKKGQVLISISARDFSFINEEHLSLIFGKIAKHGLKINLMQNSAISFSICLDNKGEKTQKFINDLQLDFKVKYNDQMELITIQHYNQEIINNLIGKRNVYLEQKNRTTVQLLVR